MAEDDNVSRFHTAQWHAVRNAMDADDDDELERLCHEGLEDPFLPPLYRAEFHVILSAYENAQYHLDEVEKMANFVERLLEREGNRAADQYVPKLRERILTLRALVPHRDEIEGELAEDVGQETTVEETTQEVPGPTTETTTGEREAAGGRAIRRSISPVMTVRHIGNDHLVPEAPRRHSVAGTHAQDATAMAFYRNFDPLEDFPFPPPPSRRRLSPIMHRRSPEKRRISPEKRLISPENRRISPEKRQPSPEKRQPILGKQEAGKKRSAEYTGERPPKRKREL